MQRPLLPTFRGGAAERTLAGLCAVDGCLGTPVFIDAIGAAWCAKCAAVIQEQNRPRKGRA